MSTELEWAAIPSRHCNIGATLASGQTFRWRERGGEWLGPIADSAVRLRPCEEGFYWQSYPEPGRWELVHRYFALDLDLESLQQAWIKAEPKILPAVKRFS